MYNYGRNVAKMWRVTWYVPRYARHEDKAEQVIVLILHTAMHAGIDQCTVKPPAWARVAGCAGKVKQQARQNVQYNAQTPYCAPLYRDMI